MKAKLLSMIIVMAMISTVGGTSIFARANDPRTKDEETRTSADTASSAKGKVAENPRLKRDMQKLLADAKAGKIAPRPQQLPNGGRQNLSTGAKIGIVAAIAGAIFAIIVIHQVNSD